MGWRSQARTGNWAILRGMEERPLDPLPRSGVKHLQLPVLATLRFVEGDR